MSSVSFEKFKAGECTICTKFFTLLHWHHTVPQALGGEDSLQIPLCSDCHNVLHAHASAYVAKITNGTSITRTYWTDENDARRSGPYLEILITSILYPPLDPEDKEYKMQVPVPKDFHSALKILKKELNGVTTLPKAILYCIAFTLKHRGIIHDNNINRPEHKKESSKQPKRANHDLW